MYKIHIQDQIIEATKEDGKLVLDAKPFNADILEYKKGKFHILYNSKSITAEVISHNASEKSFEIKVNHSVFKIQLKDKYDELLQKMGIDVTAGKKVNDIKAPMPGMVLNVMVASGQTIKKGDAIVVLEAMKMENILKSPADGIIKKIHVFKGDKVEKNQIMVNLD